jgi:glycosyltransferase involved in cell wall biosynthesis
MLPSRKEGMPYVLLEALRAGVPVLASAVGGVTEVVREGTNGMLFQSENLNDLSSKLIQLCKDAELRAQLSHSDPQDHFEPFLRETFAQYR